MERLTSWNEDCVLINGHALAYSMRYEIVQMAEHLAAYEDIAELCGGVDRLRELAEADKDGRCVVLPCTGYSDVDIVRDGVSYRPDHWNIHLTAYAHEQNTPSGLKVGLFDIVEVERAMEGTQDGV